MNIEVKKRLIACGYDYGFECPRLGSEETYPEYIRENVSVCVEKIKSHQNEDSITFAFMTDIHYLPLPHHDILLARAINAYKHICEEIQCDRLILGGDYIIDCPRENKLDGYEKLRDALMEFHYLPVNGNHDTGVLWDRVMEYEKPVNKLCRREVYNAFYDHLPEEKAVFGGGQAELYYYVDDHEKKVRYIMLDVCDEPDSYENTLNDELCISQKQLDWLANVALMTQYDMVLFAHSALRPSAIKKITAIKSKSSKLGVLMPLLDAYKRGERLEERFYEKEFALNISVDYSDKKRGNVVGLFVGHYHDDYVEYTDSGIPFVFSANFFMAECHVPRSVGDHSELLFDMVTIDRKNRTIYATRVGAGEDRTASY